VYGHSEPACNWLPKGKYSIDMISVEDGKTKSLGEKKHKGGVLKFDVLEKSDFALRVKRL